MKRDLLSHTKLTHYAFRKYGAEIASFCFVNFPSRCLNTLIFFWWPILCYYCGYEILIEMPISFQETRQKCLKGKIFPGYWISVPLHFLPPPPPPSGKITQSEKFWEHFSEHLLSRILVTLCWLSGLYSVDQRSISILIIGEDCGNVVVLFIACIIGWSRTYG